MRTSMFILICVLLGVPCQADIITVDDDGPADFNNIQAAINDANDGDIIEVQPGTYTGPGKRDLDFGGKAITVQSADPNDPDVVAATVIDCQDSGRGFHFHSGETSSAVVAGLTITGGSADYGGGVYCDFSSPTIRNCVFRDNTAWAGSGISIVGSSSEVANCVFTANGSDDANSTGGGMGIFASTCTVTNCIFTGNTVDAGGGIVDIDSWSTVRNCVFVGNAAALAGGGVFNAGIEGVLTIINCTFTGNSGVYGSGIYSEPGGPVLTITDTILWDDLGNEEVEIYGSGSASYSDVQGGYPGTGNINADPCFVSGPEGDYYLSQVAAEQAVNSPCVDEGSDTADNAGMREFTTRTDEFRDKGIVDMGYHCAITSGSPDIDENWHVDLLDYALLAGDWLNCSEVSYLPGDITRDECVDVNDLKVLVDCWLDCYAE